MNFGSGPNFYKYFSAALQYPYEKICFFQLLIDVLDLYMYITHTHTYKKKLFIQTSIFFNIIRRINNSFLHGILFSIYICSRSALKYIFSNSCVIEQQYTQFKYNKSSRVLIIGPSQH